MGEQRDESDLGDLEDEDDSRTLFHQFVTRTNLGLNRKPSNMTSLSGTMLLPQKKGVALTSSSTRTGPVQPQSLGTHYPAASSLSNPHRQPVELKQQVKRATEAGSREAALIKQKLFLLETVCDANLLHVIVSNSQCGCSHSTSGYEQEEE